MSVRCKCLFTTYALLGVCADLRAQTAMWTSTSASARPCSAHQMQVASTLKEHTTAHAGQATQVLLAWPLKFSTIHLWACERLYVFTFSRNWPGVYGIPQCLLAPNYIPAKAKALPGEGPSALASPSCSCSAKQV